MQIVIYQEHWSAELLVSDAPLADGCLQVYATTKGDTLKAARAGADWILNTFAAGRLAFVRNAPEADTERDFDTKEEKHRGFVRFTFKPETGEWLYPSQETVSVGFAHA